VQVKFAASFVLPVPLYVALTLFHPALDYVNDVAGRGYLVKSSAKPRHAPVPEIISRSGTDATISPPPHR